MIIHGVEFNMEGAYIGNVFGLTDERDEEIIKEVDSAIKCLLQDYNATPKTIVEKFMTIAQNENEVRYLIWLAGETSYKLELLAKEEDKLRCEQQN